MVEFSLWKNLLKNEEFKKNYEIYVYSMNYLDKQLEDYELINKLNALNIKFYSPQKEFIQYGFYYPHLQKAIRLREKIIEDKIDYLILTVSGYDISNFIFSNRSAPKQIYWSHGNCAFDIPNIDKRISHFNQECKEFKWKTFNVPMAKEFLVGSEAEKENGLLIKQEMLKEFGEDTIFLGTIGRLVKIESEEYLKAISEIMKQNPNTIYLACGDGNVENVKKVMKKVGVDLDRVIFTGMVNPHIFGWVIDVWPETFPLRQGNSRNEYEAKGGTIIGYKKYYTTNAIKDIEEIVKNLGIISPLANSLDEFVSLTTKTIKDKEYREKLERLYLKLRDKYSKFNINEFLKAIN